MINGIKINESLSRYFYAGNTYAGARIFFVLKEDLPFKTYIKFVA